MVSKEELKSWLDEVIRLQRELTDKFCELDKSEGIRICTSNLDVCIQFYTGMEKVLKALDITPVYNDDWSKENIAITARYNGIDLIQLDVKEVENEGK